MSCPFCNIDQKRVISQTVFWYVVRDLYPVNKGHTLIILKKHEPSIMGICSLAWDDLRQIIYNVVDDLRENFDCNGFNIGVNDGESAGQTIPHLHIHVIPRFDGDCENPRGGVRKVKPPLVDY